MIFLAQFFFFASFNLTVDRFTSRILRMCVLNGFSTHRITFPHSHSCVYIHIHKNTHTHAPHRRTRTTKASRQILNVHSSHTQRTQNVFQCVFYRKYVECGRTFIYQQFLYTKCRFRTILLFERDAKNKLGDRRNVCVRAHIFVIAYKLILKSHTRAATDVHHHILFDMYRF